MSRQLGYLVMAGALMIAAAPAHSGDAEAGLAVARTWCAHCHVVETSQDRASDVAPPFAQIANDPSKSARGIAVWLADPHPPMPNLNLAQQEIDDFVAYIATLKTD